MSKNFDSSNHFTNNGRTIYNPRATPAPGGVFANEGKTIYSQTRSNREARITRTARTDATIKASSYRIGKKASQRPRGTPWEYGRREEYAPRSVPAHGHMIGLSSASTNAATPHLAAGAESVDARDRRSEAAAALLSMSMGTGANAPAGTSRNHEHEHDNEYDYDSDRTYQGSNDGSDMHQTAVGQLLQAQPPPKLSVSMGNYKGKGKAKAESDDDYAEPSNAESDADMVRFSKGGWASGEGSGEARGTRRS